jgi:WD repeat-containing protein 81
MEEFEKATLFAELEYHLDATYDYADASTCCSSDKFSKTQIADQILQQECAMPVAADFDFASFLECFESDCGSPVGYQELLLWNQESYSENELHANDAFSIGCMVAEMYLQRPLFNTAMLAAYKEISIVPGALQELPSHVALLVKSCIQRDWKR